MHKKQIYSKLNSNLKSKKSKIFLSLYPLLLDKYLRNKISKSNKLINYNGIFLITDNKSIPIEHNLKDIKDISFISYYIISLAYRFKRLKINKNCSKYYSLPFLYNLDLNLRYIISTIELITKRYDLKDQNIEIFLNKLNDKYINIFLKRYYKKRYNINLKFVALGKIIKPNKSIYYLNNSCNPLSLLSIFKLIPFKTINSSDKLFKTKILEISSFVKAKKPYQINKKESYLNNINSLEFNDLFKYGLNKYKSVLYFIVKFLTIKNFNIIDIYRIIKYNLLLDYVQININRLFIYNTSIFLRKNNFEYLFCTHRSQTYESLLYQACRLSNVKSIASDFSLGTPLKNIFKKDITLTTRPDIMLVNSLFRKEQYFLANKDYINSGNKFQAINCSCMQVEYARRNSKNLNNIKNSKNTTVISIFDNNYGENLGIRSKYTHDLARCLYKNKVNIYCLVHSKFKLLNLENALLQNKINFCKGIKGDFSLDINSDLIVSVGFQGAAIKSAFAFNKPIIFFCSDNNYFDSVTFFEDQTLNKNALNSFKGLIFGISELELLLSDKLNRNKNLIKLLHRTVNFLECIGFSNQNIDVTSYLKDL